MPTHLDLGEKLTSDVAAEVHESLLRLRGQDVSISATRVKFVGGLCLQVLLTAQRQWQADDLAFDVIGASDHFKAGLMSLGLARDHFDCGTAS